MAQACYPHWFQDNNKMQHKSGSESECQTSVCMHNKIALHSCDKVGLILLQIIKLDSFLGSNGYETIEGRCFQ